ncbi:hypothetical protein Pla110_02550 [Polystyrenella longa]|uniref:DUF58 domain-containing protein n=1 Tax=Polystyrenella longa TaxID=2528007 RepID=A0A518CH49_9PLAN|nr:DUF58 domain-containing protein [Polystyrenella longa]QDU78551.1 hypothetical protein Pla110_02550 [Polystyrenella longa]
MRLFFISLVVLVVAIYLQLGFFVYATYVLMGVLLLSYYLTRNAVENLSVRRYCVVETAEVGEYAEVELRIDNSGSIPVPWVILEDSVPMDALTMKPSKITIEGERMSIISVGSKGQKKLKYKIVFNSRGYYQIGPTMLESGDVFGLNRRYRVLTKPIYIMVYPKVVPLAGFSLESRRPMGEVRMSHRLFEDPSRISGVREYIEGDALNRIHWKASARTGKLHCKTFEPSCVMGSTILLDFHVDNYPSEYEPYKSDLAVTAVASMANAVSLLGQQIGLITNGRDAVDRLQQEGYKTEFRSRNAAQENLGMKTTNDRLSPLIVETRRGYDQFMQIRETLARVELTDGLSFAQLVEESRSRMVRDATIVAVLGKVDEDIAATLGSLRRQGFAVTAILIRFDEDDLSEAMGKLITEGIDTRRVNHLDDIAYVCSQELV